MRRKTEFLELLVEVLHAFVLGEAIVYPSGFSVIKFELVEFKTFEYL